MLQHTSGVIIFVLSRTSCLQMAVFPSYVSLQKGRSESFQDGRKSGRVITSELRRPLFYRWAPPLKKKKKGDGYDREWHRCKRCTTLVTRKLVWFLRIGKWAPLFGLLFEKRASESTAIQAGSKMECVVLCNFHFCCPYILLSANEKDSNFFVCPKHCKTSSTSSNARLNER